jgi:hypothetical protein
MNVPLKVVGRLLVTPFMGAGAAQAATYSYTRNASSAVFSSTTVTATWTPLTAASSQPSPFTIADLSSTNFRTHSHLFSSP